MTHFKPAAVALLLLELASCAPSPAYDLVIANGRVMDPESGLDSVRHVGIREGRIEVLSPTSLRGTRIIDARAPMFFEGAGMPEHGHAAGHIPGAKNIPFNTLMNDSMQVLGREELRRIFTAAGVQQGDTVVAYCHIGQQASLVWFTARLAWPTSFKRSKFWALRAPICSTSA